MNRPLPLAHAAATAALPPSFPALVLDNMSEGVCVAKESGQIVYANAALEAMFGYAHGEMVGVDLGAHDEHGPEHTQRRMAEVAACLRERGTWQGEWRHRKKDGIVFGSQTRITALAHAGVSLQIWVLRDAPGAAIARIDARHAENVLSILLDNIDDHLVSYDRHWRYTFVNAAAARLLGKRREELLGRSIWDIFPNAVGNQYYQELHAVLEQRQMLVSEHYFAPWAAWFENRFYPSSDGVTVFSTDITQRKRTELAFRDTEQRLQLALKAGAMGAWQWHMLQDQSLWLEGMAEVHGLPPGSAITSMAAYMELVHPDDRERVAQTVADAVRIGRGHRLEYRIIRPDGSVRWIEAHARIFTDQNGVPQQMAGVCIDITPRKRFEQNLQFLAGASAELASLVDHQSTLDKIARLAVPGFADWCAVDLLQDDGSLHRVAVAHVDPDKVQLARELNRRYPPDPEAPNGTWQVLRSGRAALVPDITDAMLAASAKDAEFLGILRTLGLKSYIGAPLSVRGKTLGVISFICAESKRRYDADDLALAEDLARRAAVAIENAELYRALQQSDRRKDVFLATLAHELRNPLAPVANALSIMRLNAHDRAAVESATELMERQLGQLTRLVDDLMDVARIKTGKIELRRRQADLTEILQNAIETSRPHIEAAGHALSVELQAGAAMVSADPVRLAQVFANLLNNAAKYTNPGGRISLRLERDGDSFAVRVKDSGIGIPPEMLRQVFSMFAQVRHPRERSQGGLGIGLSLVDGLVALHDGRVEARSAGPGHGSEFVVRLPRWIDDRTDSFGPTPANAPANAPTSSPAAEQPAKRRVLVVDDNVDAANTTAELLRLFGHTVEIAHDGLSAVDAAVRMRPDVALLDIGLPGIDGFEVARRIRSQLGAQPVLVALTGWGQEQDRSQAIDAGFDAHWVKPVELDQLMQLPQRQ